MTFTPKRQHVITSKYLLETSDKKNRCIFLKLNIRLIKENRTSEKIQY